MSRESKLALIIGFTLILIVGVLVSDHLSKASSDALDEPVAEAGGGPGSVLPPVAERRLLHDAIVHAQREPEPVVADPLVAADTAPQYAVQTPAGSPTLRVDPAPPAEPAPVVIAMGTGAGQRADETRDEEPLQRLATAAGLTLDRVANGSRPLVQTTQTLAGSTIRVSGRQHEVEEGESLFQIAARYLGSGHRWPEIRDANPGVVASDGGVAAGVVLRIPASSAETPARAADARPAPTAPRQDARPPDTKKTAAAKPDAPRADTKKPESKATTYTVQKGDTLGAIAQKTLGSVKRMQDLLDANKSKIKDADDIKVGMVLSIPPR